MIKKSSPLGAEALFLAALLYATTGALVREMGHMWSNNAQVAARSVVVLVILLIYSAFRKSKHKIPRDKLPYAVGLGVLFATSMILFTWAFQETTLSNTYLTSYATNIVVSFLLGTLILKESASHRKIAAIVLCLIGLLFYSNAIFSGTTGIIFSILSGVVGGFSGLFSKQLRGVNRTAVLKLEFAICAVVATLVTLFSGEKIIHNPNIYGFFITLIFAGVLILAGNLVLYGFQHFDVNIATVITASELIFGSLFGYLFYKEIPTPYETIGGVIILSGAVLSGVNLQKIYLKISDR